MDSRLEKWVGAIALATGIIAIILACRANIIASEANEIASKQVSPQIIVVDAEGGVGGYSGRKNYCLGSVFLANLGGAGSSIVNFNANIGFLEEQIELDSGRDGVARGYQEVIQDDFHNFAVFLVSESPGFDEVLPDMHPPEKYSLELPIAIDSFETIDLDFLITYEREFTDPYATYQSDRFPRPDLIPLWVSYTFNFSNESTITTPRINCTWYRYYTD